MMLFTGPVSEVKTTLPAVTSAEVTSSCWSSIVMSVVPIAMRRSWLV